MYSQTWTNDHLPTATTISDSQFRSLWNKLISEKRPPVNNGHKFGVPRVVVALPKVFGRPPCFHRWEPLNFLCYAMLSMLPMSKNIVFERQLVILAKLRIPIDSMLIKIILFTWNLFYVSNEVILWKCFAFLSDQPHKSIYIVF
jgi:hypothetical protein